jgi:hypothetical protein
VLGSVSSDAGEIEAGAGLNIPLSSSGLKLYVEGRIMHGYTDKSPTTIVPLTVGFRW